jgi:hypothetical protein
LSFVFLNYLLLLLYGNPVFPGAVELWGTADKYGFYLSFCPFWLKNNQIVRLFNRGFSAKNHAGKNVRVTSKKTNCGEPNLK